MSIATQITALTADKTAIENAITTKGGTLSQNRGFDTFASDIATIPSQDDTDLKNLIQRTGTSIRIPNGVTTIGEYAFYTTGIKNISLPNGVTSINNYAFAVCRSLETVRLPDSVTTIGSNVFSTCNIKKTTFPKNLTTLGNGIGGYGAWQLVIWLAEISFGLGMFGGSPWLKKVVLSAEKVVPLSYPNALGQTPFTGYNNRVGTAYIPKVQVTTGGVTKWLKEWYQEATNWSSLYQDGTCVFVEMSEATFTGDGTTTTFTMINPPSEIFYIKINGDYIREYEYTYENGVITFNESPANNASIVVFYDGSVTTTFSGDGMTTIFTYTNGKPTEVYYVNVGNTMYAVGSNFDVTYDSSTGILTFTTAPASGTDNIEVYSNEVTV